MVRGSGGSQRQGPWWSNPRLLKLAIESWNVTSLMGKELELVQEVERYQLDIVGVTSMHIWGSGTSFFERGWAFFYAGVVPHESRRAGVSLLIAP